MSISTIPGPTGPGNAHRDIPGCPCGGGDHPPDSHLWTYTDIARASRATAGAVREDRKNRTCPLHDKGQGRRRKEHVFSFAEVQAYLHWVCRF